MYNLYKPLSIILVFSLMVCSISCNIEYSDTQEYDDLVNKYNTLLQQNNDLIQQYNSLLEQNNKSREELKTALEGAIVPPYITMNGRKASYSFRNLDNQIESWSFDVEALEASTLVGTFMRNVDIPELNRLGLSFISKRFNNGNKNISLGGRFNCLDFRPYINKEYFPNLASEFFLKHADDESKIKEVWNFITQLCPYTGEMKETLRLPLETLLFGGGDCEDLAILTASILRAMSSDWIVQLVYMDSDNPTSINDLNHVTVFVDTGTYTTFVESTENTDMCPYDTVDGFYLDVP